jgi:hypothetical protein
MFHTSLILIGYGKNCFVKEKGKKESLLLCGCAGSKKETE